MKVQMEEKKVLERERKQEKMTVKATARARKSTALKDQPQQCAL